MTYMRNHPEQLSTSLGESVGAKLGRKTRGFCNILYNASRKNSKSGAFWCILVHKWGKTAKLREFRGSAIPKMHHPEPKRFEKWCKTVHLVHRELRLGFGAPDRSREKGK